MTKSVRLSGSPGVGLGFFDTVSLIVGIVLGAGVFETPPLVFATAGSGERALLAWGLGGVLSLVGGLCYAELATAYPRVGGDYIYLSRAFGRLVGFLFGWANLVVILTGTIAMMAYVFADYFAALVPMAATARGTAVVATASVFCLTALNVVGVRTGRLTQNILSAAKVSGVCLVLVAGFFFARATKTSVADAFGPTGNGANSTLSVDGFALAMVFVLYTYGGWNDAAFVAADMRDRRSIPRALVAGTAFLLVIYVLLNAAFLWGLGPAKVASSRAIAADLLASTGRFDPRLVAFLVMISALGSMNGMIFAGARLFSTLGAEHALFSRLSESRPRIHFSRVSSFSRSFVVQAGVSLFWILAVGSDEGRALMQGAFAALGLQVTAWEGHGGFGTLLQCTAPVFWSFFLLTGLSLFVLRRKDADLERPFRVPLYPLTPLLFVATCAFMLYRSLTYAGEWSLVGFGFLLLGVPAFLWSKSRVAAEHPPTTTVSVS